MSKLIRLRPGESLPSPLLEEIAAAARRGGVIAFPTDTVYGLGTSALSPEGIRRIFALKDRDSRKALPILVHSSEEARRWVAWSPAAEALAQRFWPGPLTVVLPPSEEGRSMVSPGKTTLAVRVPAHPVALSLLKASGLPWATTSANDSGKPELVTGAEVAAAFQERVDYVVDAGAVGGQVSTLVDLSRKTPAILREGALESATVLEPLRWHSKT